ncbi:hypothetical protein D9758_015972 [Tetrapyrgos nigripes]|uniref:CHAT domain-containing protein n=1 Tax=Tetrapyrgos nigripes TaxID=182062 RepID=A0A8H5FDB8_9AGAR|nr:hypothetical protein D9758_015972 [Tetrapyrgos nigripes]
MSEYNIPLEEPTRGPATDVGADRTLTPSTLSYHEDEAAELEVAIKNMSLEQSNAEATEDSSVNDTPIDMEQKVMTGLDSLIKELNNSAVEQLKHFQESGDCAAIDDAVQLFGEAVNLTPESHASKAALLTNLGGAFQHRFERLGELGDIKDAIQVRQQAVDLTPDSHADKASWLSNLGGALQRRFERIGELGDIKDAIQVGQQAVDLTPDGHAHKAALLNNLGGALQRRFERLGELGDIEDAIRVMRQAVDLTPDSHADKASFLNNLGNAFQCRFQYLGNWGTLRMQFSILPQQPRNAIQCRFECLGELGDIENAILVTQQAVNLTPDGHANKASFLNNLGNAIQCRFQCVGELGDIENAIRVKQEAVNLTPDGYADKAAKLNNLGGALQCRFERLGELGDIEDAIRVLQQAVDLTPDGHADKAARLNNLGGALQGRFEHIGELGDIKNVISTFQQSTKNTCGPPSIRYHAACKWATLSSAYQDSSSALDAYKVVLEIIPQLIWPGQTVHQRYEELPKIVQTINAAVATAISAENLTQAVEWLEEGRRIVWGQILQLRLSLDNLRDWHSSLAQNLERISTALQNAGTSTHSDTINNPNTHTDMTGKQEAQQHTQLAAEYEALIAVVRKLNGFDSFLKPKKLSALTPAAVNGPVIIINVDRSRCDALVLSSSHSTIHIPLPDFSSKQAEEMYSEMISSLQDSGVRVDCAEEQFSVMQQAEMGHDQLKSILARLWSTVVQPIFSEIEDVLHDSAEGCLPHITWCVTGALALLPLHAAGIYGSKDPADDINLSDFAVSSYTTTLSAMLKSGHKPHQRDPRDKPKVLIVSQPDTKEEARIIQTYTSPEHSCHLTCEEAVVETVKREMGKYEIVHLACHGIQDSKNPLDSAFTLYDGRLKLHDLMGLSLENAELAFLSACQIVASNEKLPEEGVNLVAGMLAVGYPSVITTMWSIGNKDTPVPVVADKVYESLLGHRNELETQNLRQSAAYALHAAVKHLRKEVGEMQFIKWVPFVHYGV